MTVVLARKLEYVWLKRDPGVELHDLGERVPGGEPKHRVENLQRGIVEIEEAVAIAEGLELLLPYRALELAEDGPVHVPLGDHPDEGVKPIDRAVDRLEARGDSRAADAGHHLLLGRFAVGRDDVSVRVPKLDEVKDVRVVDRVPGIDQRIDRKLLRGLPGDIDEGCLGG